MKKYTLEFIEKEFRKDGYTLLSKEYKNNKQKLSFKCPNGHVYSIRWNNWILGQRCAHCYGNVGISLDFIKKEFEKEGYILLTKKYKNNKQKLEFICPKGHQHTISWNMWQKGRRCFYCFGTVKKTLDFVKKEFEKEHYTLLTNHYERNSQKLDYICPRGHVGSMNWNNWKGGHRCGECVDNSGANNYNWKGGYSLKKIPTFDRFYDLISYAEEIRRSPKDYNILEVKCAYCGKWFIPKLSQADNRVGVLEGRLTGEHRFYCSDKCKNECPIYKKHKYPAGYKKTTSREVQPELRQMVFERDNWICQKCGKHQDKLKTGLHCHHFEGIKQNPIESADIDNCITLCKKCHKWVHSQEGCKYFELRCFNE